jgi:hypothetical protein
MQAMQADGSAPLSLAALETGFFIFLLAAGAPTLAL